MVLLWKLFFPRQDPRPEHSMHTRALRDGRRPPPCSPALAIVAPICASYRICGYSYAVYFWRCRLRLHEHHTPLSRVVANECCRLCLLAHSPAYFFSSPRTKNALRGEVAAAAVRRLSLRKIVGPNEIYNYYVANMQGPLLRCCSTSIDQVFIGGVALALIRQPDLSG